MHMTLNVFMAGCGTIMFVTILFLALCPSTADIDREDD